MRRWPISLLAPLALVACGEIPDVTSAFGGSLFLREPVREVSVADDSVTIAGPFGYCIDTASLESGEAGVFVLLGSCASLSRARDAGRPRVPGILTATVSEFEGASSSDSVQRLAAFLQTEDGRRALSRSGDPDTVQIIWARPEGDALYLHARDTSPDPLPDVSPAYWRAFLAIEGRIVTVSVVPFAERPMSPDTGLRTLDAFVRQVEARNG